MITRLSRLVVPLFLLTSVAVADTVNVDQRWQRFRDEGVAATRQNDWHAAQRPYELALDAARALSPGDDRRVEALEGLARVYNMVGLKHEAIDLRVEALEQRRALGDPAELVPVMATLVGNYKAIGMFADAETLHRERLLILEGLATTDAADISWPLRELAHIVQRSRPDDEEIETLLVRALELSDHPETTASAASALAAHVAGRGEHDRAAGYYELAIEQEQRRSREDPARLAPLRQALARQLGKSGRADEARDQLTQAVELRERQFGPHHPYLVTVLRDLGASYAETDDLTQAAELLRRGATLATRARGAEHGCDRALHRLLADVEEALASGEPLAAGATAAPSCSTSDDENARRRREIADLRHRGDFPQALDLAEQIIVDAQIEHGFDSLERADALTIQASLQRGYGKIREAVATYESALSILEIAAADDANRLSRVLRDLAYAHLSMQQLGAGLDYQRRTVEVLELFGGTPMDRAIAVQALARQLRSVGEHAESAERFVDAADAWSEVAGDGAPEVARNRRESAACRLELDQFDRAEELLLEAADGLDPSIDPQPYAVSHAKHLLARLYAETGRPEEARAAREQATTASRRNRFDVDD